MHELEDVLREYVKVAYQMYLRDDTGVKEYMSPQAYVRSVTLNELEYAINDVTWEGYRNG